MFSRVTSNVGGGIGVCTNCELVAQVLVFELGSFESGQAVVPATEDHVAGVVVLVPAIHQTVLNSTTRAAI